MNEEYKEKLLKDTLKREGGKIVLLVVDGLGGLPDQSSGLTELEAAVTPNLDRLARESACGLTEPIGPGITPGSGPAHLALFGYDPVKYVVGRGVLAALGVGFDLEAGDVAARINFATFDQDGNVTDRRAGRIPTELCDKLCDKLAAMSLDDVEFFISPVRDYRAVLIMRAGGLGGKVTDTDPQTIGRKPLEPRGLDKTSEKTAALAAKFISNAFDILKDESPANGLLLRGFDQCPQFPSFTDRYGLSAAALAAYPMYRGVARTVGMTVIPVEDDIETQFQTLASSYGSYDFFFVHLKKADAYGEDGNYKEKAAFIEKADKYIPMIEKLDPDVFIVTGDHSTPSQMKSHGWHPVPFMLHSKWCRGGLVEAFGERELRKGELGILSATSVMQLALAHAGRTVKFGA